MNIEKVSDGSVQIQNGKVIEGVRGISQCELQRHWPSNVKVFEVNDRRGREECCSFKFFAPNNL